jgi:hypothetical protein
MELAQKDQDISNLRAMLDIKQEKPLTINKSITANLPSKNFNSEDYHEEDEIPYELYMMYLNNKVSSSRVKL